MNLQKINLRSLLIVTIVFTLAFPVLIPSWRLHVYIPFIITLFYQRPLIKCLWAALFYGLFLDLLSPHQHLGIYAINFVVTAFLLYPQRRHFFADNLSTLPIMTGLFSFISTSLHFILIRTFEQKLSITAELIIKDLLMMPLLDAFTAYTLFILPPLLLNNYRRRRTEEE